MAHQVRAEHGTLPCQTLEDHGYSIHAIKDWRAAEYDAGRASGLDDFYAAHGLCFECRAEGVIRVPG